jgi:hypothetical protein
MSENQNPTAVTNLRDTKKAMAAALKAHPAGKAAPAKKAPVAAAKKTPAKAFVTAADKSPRKTPVQSGKVKLRWKKQDDGGLVATTDEAIYTIRKSGNKFAGVVKRGGKTQVIVDNVSDGTAYQVLTRLYHTGELPQPKKATAPAKKGA